MCSFLHSPVPFYTLNINDVVVCRVSLLFFFCMLILYLWPQYTETERILQHMQTKSAVILNIELDWVCSNDISDSMATVVINYPNIKTVIS